MDHAGVTTATSAVLRRFAGAADIPGMAALANARTRA